MPQKHDVIALISGGKDSFLSLLHCLAQNHRIIALANLYPSAPDPASDLNSFMYQTVGHTLVPLYATALDIPLYRGEIFGSAGVAQRDYDPNVSSPTLSSGRFASSIEHFPKGFSIEEELGKGIFDETESLLPLLRHIIAVHPTASALSSGAILSTYQRTRIESVALRLNLTPLAYLWQYPILPCPIPSQSSLLQQLVAVGLEARIVKVASGGLHEGHLWLDLRDEGSRKKVEKGLSRFGGSMLGEGGEYETIVVNGPSELFKKRIEVGEGERWIGRGEGGEAWLGFSGGKAVIKESGNGEEGFMRRLRVPELWDKGFEEIVRRVIGEVRASLRSTENIFTRKPNQDDWNTRLVTIESASTITFCNVLAPLPLSNGKSQMCAIIDFILSLLATHHLSPSAIIFTSLLLRSMSDFVTVNTVYSTIFSQPNPPARVTVGCGDALPEGVHVMASFVVNARDETRKQGLHVQSRSYWAPANIGAYSQAVALEVREVNEENGKTDSEVGEKVALVYVAGQIPLMPATMEVLSEEDEISKDVVTGGADFLKYGLGLFCKQACLALQHLWRIGKAMDVGWWTGGVAFIVGEEDDVQEKANAAWLTWKMAHERDFAGADGLSEECVDIWDQTYGGGVANYAVSNGETDLPNFEKVRLGSGTSLEEDYVPGFFAVQVDELPRGCKIEWQALGVQNGVVRVGLLAKKDMQLSSCSLQTCGTTVSYLGIPMSSLDQSLESSILKTLDKAKSMVQIDRGEKAQAFPVQVTVYTPYMSLVGGLDAQIVPCRAVWGPGKAEMAAGIVFHSEKRR